MQRSDRPKFLECISALASAFGKEPTEAMLQGYWLGLQDLELADLQSSVTRSIRESEWFPKPIELRRFAGVMSHSERAVIAWSAVTKAVGSKGSYASVDFDDPIVNATLRNMGGWEELCKKDQEDFAVWARKDFERIYNSLCNSGVSEEAAKYLPGRTERENEGSDWGGRVLGMQPRKVLTGLPPHPKSVVKKLGPKTTHLIEEKSA